MAQVAERVALLRNAHIFRELVDEELEPIARACALQVLSAGDIVFHEGTPGRAFFVLVEGRVRLIRVGRDGGEKVIELIQPGETFAEAVVFRGEAYPVTAVCIDPCRLVMIPGTVIVERLTACPELALRLLASLSKRLHRFVKDIHALTLSSAEQRIAGFLLGFQSDRFSLPATKATLASRLGLTPQHFSRVFSGLKERGVIAEEHGMIRIIDRGALTRLTDVELHGTESP